MAREAISEQRPRWTPMNIHQAQNLDEKVRMHAPLRN
ncbi:Ascorbate utilization transcriptional regulator UlaR [Klebsiella pneumoniae]|uniref:Ascorbate utilization transcriptional regulator UlaR n=1 Tax=Klebsiella pneumoniae TaxID=573 RepID=A0A378B9G2_KLEPN|nr:Ascorbate utilization transcriptional regulator UlaR [Klebsiella pneumoniae]